MSSCESAGGRVVRMTAEEGELTMKVLSRLRDLWELSNGYICLPDYHKSTQCLEDFEEEKMEEAEGLQTKEEPSRESMDAKRMNIVKEIISTEETYIQGLQELIDVFPSLLLSDMIDLRGQLSPAFTSNRGLQNSLSAR